MRSHGACADIHEPPYYERVVSIFNQMDIRTAFVTQSQLDNYKLIIAKAKDYPGSVSSAELHIAQKTVNSIVHPQTGENIFLPLRMSTVIPVNMVLDTLMLKASTPLGIVASQWLNQTYNALHYAANANKSNPESDMQHRIQAYGMATTGSALAALGMNHASLRSSGVARPVLRFALATFGPWMGVAVADIINISTMRQNEFKQGIHVYDEHGRILGRSPKAGTMAVASCIVARVCAATPVLVISPIVIHQLERKTDIFLRRPWLKLPVLLGTIGVMIQCAVPLCFGAFHQIASVPCNRLEEQFHDESNPQRIVYYYKGL